MMNIDFVIISNAKNKELSDITTNCIQSLLDSECSSIFKFKIIVIESNLTQKPYDFTQTIYTEDKFGYNKFLNIGLKYCASDKNIVSNHLGLFEALVQPSLLL